MRARSPVPTDAPVMGKIHVAAWRAAYDGLMPDDYLAALDVGERAQMWRRLIARPRDRSRLVVVERDGAVVGFAALGATTDSDNADDLGELFSINVDPSQWRSGVGTALLTAVHGDLAALGFTEAILWVHPENHRARLFYEESGWRFDETERTADVLGVIVPEVRYRKDLTPPKAF